MLSVDEAVQAVLQRARPFWTDRVPLDSCGPSVILAEEVQADRDSPPFDKALLDGFAIRAEDLASGGDGLLVIEEVTAGRVPSKVVGPGQAIAIMTGAPMPQGADAVVMVEHSERFGERVTLRPPKPVRQGDGWMPRGREMREGEVVARPGDRLTPSRNGLLASVGRVRPLVHLRPKVAIVSTGDELVDPAYAPGPGQIRNSNTSLLVSMVRSAGAKLDVHPIAPDRPEVLAERLHWPLTTEADLLLITGGVSAGKLDLIPGILEQLGVEPVFHKVRLKPGKPIFFGVGPTRKGSGAPGALVFGLPGNPVSAIVGYLLFARPAQRAIAGEKTNGPRLRHGGVLSQPFSHRGDRPTYHPARWIEPEPGTADPARIEPLPWAGSPDLRAVAEADGFAVFPEGDREHPAGSPLAFLPM